MPTRNENILMDIGFIISQEFDEDEWRFIAKFGKAISIASKIWYLHLFFSKMIRIPKERAIDYLLGCGKKRIIGDYAVCFLVTCSKQDSDKNKPEIERAVIIHTPGFAYQSFFFVLP